MTNATAPITGTPRVPLETVRAGAIEAGVCVRPIIRQMVDTETGESALVPIPCQATLASICPSCAERARRLRMQQCREGWHLDTEPEGKPREVREDDDQDDQEGDAASRTQRSTRRRDDVPDLPRLPIDARTVGRSFEAPDGKMWRPSMFLTCTMPSYGRVRDDGIPVDPAQYNYRRAALDTLHFSKLWDRFVQNLRRASAIRCSTSPRSNRNAASLHTSTPRSAERSRASSCARSWPPRTPRCGGRDTIGSSTR